MTKRKKRLLIFLILVVAIFARTWQITSIPGGLFPDQAANGEDALSILSGDIRSFYERGNGREALFFYIEAALIALFGVKVWPLFLASALVGIATVWAVYAAGEKLFNIKVGLLSGLLLAANHWHVIISRTGFRAILIPLFLALTYYFAASAAKAGTTRSKYGHAIGAGISFGLGWYTYIGYRAFIGVILLMAVFYLWRDITRIPHFRDVKKFGRSALVGALFSIIVFLPLGYYFVQNPGSFVGRAGHVSVFNPDLNEGNVVRTVADVTADSIMAFFTEGDENPRHNVPGHPFLSPLTGLFLIIGLLIVLKNSLKYLYHLVRGKTISTSSAYMAVLLLTMAMFTPTIATAEGIPHGLRSVGLVAPVFWMAGIGGAWLLNSIKKLPSIGIRKLTAGVLGFFIALTLFYELALYFYVMPSLPVFWYEYRTDLTAVSEYINDRAEKNQSLPYLALGEFSVQTVHFLTAPHNQPYRLVKPEKSHEVNLNRGETIIFTQSTLPDAVRYEKYHPRAREVIHKKNQFGESTMIVYTGNPF